MSVFSPLDVRGPDQRRKNLIQKLMGQAQGGRGSAVPMPGMRSGALASSGRPFRSVGDFRGAPHAAVTQRSNILPSILARLGAMGHSNPDEISGGPGMAIMPPVGRGMNLPTPSGGTPIPAMGVGPGHPDTPALGPQPNDPGLGRPAVGGPPMGAPTGTPGDGGGMMPLGGHGPFDLNAGGLGGSDPNLTPLGNGLYYDATTGTVVGAPQSSAGGAARRL